jgi:hypothetical protein
MNDPDWLGSTAFKISLVVFVVFIVYLNACS